MILCTENDKEFIKYKDKVKNKKTIFTIKQIFTDWWKNFLEAYPNLTIRSTVFTNVKRMLKCQSWSLGYAIFKCPEYGNEKIVPHNESGEKRKQPFIKRSSSLFW